MILRQINPETLDVRRGEDPRVREFIISTERRDGHGTIIRMDAWKLNDFNRAGAFYYQHQTGSTDGSDPDNALGPASARIEDGQLIGRAVFEPGDFNPLAEKILAKVDFGTLRSTSVGFMPNGYNSGHWGVESRSEDPETYYFTDVSLKEFSIVHIPSNPDAIKKSMEGWEAYMSRVADKHKSEGFRKDYHKNKARRQIQYLIELAEKRNYF